MARGNGRRHKERNGTVHRDLGHPAVEAESVALGTLLSAQPQSAMVLERLRPDDFAIEANRMVYEACSSVQGEHGTIDVSMVVDELESADNLEQVGGMSYIGDLLDYSPSPGVSVEPHVRTIIERSVARQFIVGLEAASEIARGKGYRDARQLLDDRVTRIEDRIGEAEDRDLVTLAQLIADPSMFAPPRCEIPRLAWSARVTLLVAREKTGKSTFAAYGAAEKSRGGWFLGENCEQGRVLWVGIDEHIGDAGRRLETFGAAPESLYLTGRLDGLEALRRKVAHVRPAVTVIDNLAALAVLLPEPPDSGDYRAWTPLMKDITSTARTYDTAIVLVHHAAKSGGARDSTAITAEVDMILEMTEIEGDSDVRKVKARGRWQAETYTVRLAGERFVLEGGELSMDTRILLFVESHPECSVRSVCAGVTGKTVDINAALQRLIARGAIRDTGGGTRSGRQFVAGKMAIQETWQEIVQET
jgi:hypothetical protein